MKVWSIHTGEPPTHYTGGRKLRASLLADALRRRGHSVVWWSGNIFHATKARIANGYLAQRLEGNFESRLLNGVPYVRNVSLRRFAHYKRLAKGFAAQAPREELPDLIVAAIPDYDVACAAVEFGNARGIPVIVDIQDIWPEIFVSRLPKTLRHVGRAILIPEFRKLRSTLSRATGILACSHTYLDWGLNQAGRAQTETDGVFFLGYPDLLPADWSIVSPSLRELLDALAPYTVLTFMGGFGQSYDIRILLAAARHLQFSHPQLRFVLAGTGDQFEAIKRESRDLKNVTLTGWLEKQDVAALLERSHLGMATYRSTAPQSLPYKPFEYLAYGLPIVSSLQGEMARLIEKHGVGVTYGPGNVDALVAGILSLVEPPEVRARTSATARKVFQSHFCVDKVYGDYAEHLEAVGFRRRAAIARSSN